MLTPEGPRAEVHHPAYRGRHPLARSAAELEATMHDVMRAEVEAWAAEAEEKAKRHPGVK